MRKRRGRGEGSVFLRADGVWTATVSLGYDGNGRRKRRTVYGQSKTEVLDRMVKAKAEGLSGIDPKSVSLSRFLDRWLESAARPSVRPSTYQRHAECVRVHIAPRIGGAKLDRLTPLHVQDLLTSMEKDGVSPATRLRVYAVLHTALRQALRWEMIGRNPCDAVRRPRVPRNIPFTLSVAQMVAFFDAAKRDRLHALYVLAGTSGMRQAELFGLAWPDVDLRNAVASIKKQNQDADTKTAASRRRMDLPIIAVQALQEHRKRMLVEGHYQQNGCVFVDTRGGPLRKSNLTRQSFRPLLKKAGLPQIRFHDLRHSHATHLLEQNVHPKIVQERLGHSNSRITMDLYSHVMPSLAKEVIIKLDAIYCSQTVANGLDNAGQTGMLAESVP